MFVPAYVSKLPSVTYPWDVALYLCWAGKPELSTWKATSLLRSFWSNRFDLSFWIWNVKIKLEAHLEEGPRCSSLQVCTFSLRRMRVPGAGWAYLGGWKNLMVMFDRRVGLEDVKALLENYLVTLLQQSTLDYSFCGKVKVFAFEIVP